MYTRNVCPTCDYETYTKLCHTAQHDLHTYIVFTYVYNLKILFYTKYTFKTSIKYIGSSLNENGPYRLVYLNILFPDSEID